MAVDTLIIGSGVVAAALAQRLLDKNPKASILILEAGDRVKTKDFALWENYLITGKLPYDRYRDLDYPQKDNPGENKSVGGTEVPLMGARLLTYGGSTLHWGGWSFRLKPEDFELKTRTGNGADWPFGYAEFEPYYVQAEHYIGVSGDSKDPTVPRSDGYPFPAFPYSLEDQPVAHAMEALGVTYSHLPIARHGVTDTTSKHAPCQTTGTCKYCPFGARFAATNYLNDMVEWNDYPNFEVRTGVIVESIVLASKQRAAGVAYITRDSPVPQRIEAERIIVAAGAIESAKLLQRSTSADWPRGVGNDNDLVGRFLVTHPYFIFTAALPANPLKLQAEMNFPTLCSRHFDSVTEQPGGKFILVNPPDTVNPKLVAAMQSGKTRDQLDARLIGANNIQLHGMLEVFGKPENRVLNSDKRNQLGLIETSVDYTKDFTFDARMQSIQTQVERIFGQMGATLSGKPSISWRADHAGSLCRMGQSDADSVIDANLRVHGVENLYVCSNASFPSIGAINPTLTLTALALRLGDHLAARPA
ncbi:GMC oxidoreductase [Roseateles sp. NT4]|uniref:GMC oxidoreductase n=1 Tax=Roseateles sp. NT4 TaxID=3453715 RepID=UPI003EED3790